MSTETIIISKTKAWIQDFIIKLNICPFAATVFNENKIAYRIIPDINNDHKEFLISSIEELRSNSTIETSLLIFPGVYSDFFDYLKLIQLGEDCIHSGGYEGDYQFASFHPNYMFENSKPKDPENFSNRSPYPMLHLIREISISEAIKHYGPTDDIPFNNIANLKDIGFDKLNTAFQNNNWSTLKK